MQGDWHDDITDIWRGFIEHFPDIGIGFSADFCCACLCGFLMCITHGNYIEGVLLVLQRLIGALRRVYRGRSKRILDVTF